MASRFRIKKGYATGLVHTHKVYRVKKSEQCLKTDRDGGRTENVFILWEAKLGLRM